MQALSWKMISGSERTFLRVRAKIGDNIILSKPFKGEINSSQFIIKKGSLYDDELKDTKNAAIYWIFYGANIKTIENR